MLWNGGMDRRTRGFVVVLCWVGLMLGHSPVENNVSFQSQIGLSQSVRHVMSFHVMSVHHLATTQTKRKITSSVGVGAIVAHPHLFPSLCSK